MSKVWSLGPELELNPNILPLKARLGLVLGPMCFKLKLKVSASLFLTWPTFLAVA